LQRKGAARPATAKSARAIRHTKVQAVKIPGTEPARPGNTKEGKLKITKHNGREIFYSEANAYFYTQDPEVNSRDLASLRIKLDAFDKKAKTFNRIAIWMRRGWKSKGDGILVRATITSAAESTSGYGRQIKAYVTDSDKNRYQLNPNELYLDNEANAPWVAEINQIDKEIHRLEEKQADLFKQLERVKIEASIQQ
jgi:hypothetical protein